MTEDLFKSAALPDATRQIVAGHMWEILQHFRSDARVTVLVRVPDEPAADFVLMDDDLAEVIAMLQKRQAEQLTAEPGLTNAEQKAQGARCGCKGIDDYCPCQNRPDAQTLAERAKEGAA